MREFTFEVTSATLALRVSKSAGKKIVVKWMNPYTPHKSINSGPVLLSIALGHEKAHLADPIRPKGRLLFLLVWACGFCN